jgi:hypothetical protein
MISISNIAWDAHKPDIDKKIAEILQRFSIRHIDLAPGKYFPLDSILSYSHSEEMHQHLFPQWERKCLDILT